MPNRLEAQPERYKGAKGEKIRFWLLILTGCVQHEKCVPMPPFYTPGLGDSKYSQGRRFLDSVWRRFYDISWRLAPSSFALLPSTCHPPTLVVSRQSNLAEGF